MKKQVTLFAALFSFAAVFAAPTITGVTATPRNPWDGKVDICVVISGSKNDIEDARCVFVATNNATSVEIAVRNVEQSGEDDFSEKDGRAIKNFVWNVVDDVDPVRIDEMSLTVSLDAPLGGVQLWAGGPYWAECNLGTSKSTSYGTPYGWGDVKGYGYENRYTPPSEGFVLNKKTEDELKSMGAIDSNGNLSEEYDAATQKLGFPWRMPTASEFKALIDKCSITKSSYQGNSYIRVSGKGAFSAKSIILPLNGKVDCFGNVYRNGAMAAYWTSTPSLSDSTEAQFFYWDSSYSYDGASIKTEARSYGFRIRPIRGCSDIVKGKTAYLAIDCRPIENPVIAPESGTTFDSTLTISMSCASESATIHYTTDGSEPTMESPVYKRFRVNGKTTVKARAFFENGSASEIVTAEYALGWCAEPSIASAGGETFYHSGNVVTIGYDGAEDVVRYTIDGSEPTAESPIYTEPFAIDASIVVKAKAFSDSYFDSAVVTAVLTREWETVATPVIAAAESFTGAKTKVQIACATEGATIRYTLNGNDPNSHSTKYTGPFFVTEGCTVKAYAVLADFTNSEIAAKTITKVWGIGDSVALPDQQFVTSGDAEWVYDGGTAMKSGEITDDQQSILSTTFVGKGALAFKWKVSCEEDADEHNWDHAAFFVDGVEIARQDGQTDWIEITHSIETEGEHAVQWVYVKDDAESDGEDCMWLKDVVWMPGKTQTTEVPVPTSWLKAKYPSLGDYYFDYEERANELAANGVNTVWECYVIGLEPTAADTRFEATIEMVDGVPKVTWSPDLGAERVYRVLGAKELGGTTARISTDRRSLREAKWLQWCEPGTSVGAEWAWKVVTEETKGDYKFFKVAVEMP